MTTKILTRFFAKTSCNPETGCVEWTKGARSKDGYGQFKLEGRRVQAHRLSYLMHKGEIPAGLEIDHLCHNPACVCPDHLEAVTKAVNLARRRKHAQKQTALA